MVKLCDGIFEGGGVKGIGLVGAVCEIEKAGYRFENVAGTSAGAIVASLLGAGFTGEEIHEEMMKLDYRKFQKRDCLTSLGLAGKAIKFAFKNGVYSAEYLEEWLGALLSRKGRETFADIVLPHEQNEKYRYKFQAIASDLSDGRLLILPRDLEFFGLKPDAFPITKAVRMSMSIPIFYEPYILTDVSGRGHMIVDGGMLSNYPVWLLDDNTPNPSHPTFGFRFCDFGTDELSALDYQRIDSPFSYVKSLVRTAMDAHDKHYVSVVKGDTDRTIAISAQISSGRKTKTISAVHFGLKDKERDALFANGQQAAREFLRQWNFENWKRKYRKKSDQEKTQYRSKMTSLRI
jgi:NTE family protein